MIIQNKSDIKGQIIKTKRELQAERLNKYQSMSPQDRVRLLKEQFPDYDPSYGDESWDKDDKDGIEAVTLFHVATAQEKLAAGYEVPIMDVFADALCTDNRALTGQTEQILINARYPDRSTFRNDSFGTRIIPEEIAKAQGHGTFIHSAEGEIDNNGCFHMEKCTIDTKGMDTIKPDIPGYIPISISCTFNFDSETITFATENGRAIATFENAGLWDECVGTKKLDFAVTLENWANRYGKDGKWAYKEQLLKEEKDLIKNLSPKEKLLALSCRYPENALGIDVTLSELYEDAERTNDKNLMTQLEKLSYAEDWTLTEDEAYRVNNTVVAIDRDQKIQLENRPVACWDHNSLMIKEVTLKEGRINFDLDDEISKKLQNHDYLHPGSAIWTPSDRKVEAMHDFFDQITEDAFFVSIPETDQAIGFSGENAKQEIKDYIIRHSLWSENVSEYQEKVADRLLRDYEGLLREQQKNEQEYNGEEQDRDDPADPDIDDPTDPDLAD